MSAEKQSNKTIFGRNLMELRKAHKLTQEQVADILKIKRSTYAYYESETTPTLDVIKKLATLFNVSVHFLLYREEENLFDRPGLRSPEPEEIEERIRLMNLTKEEAMLIGYFRLLSAQNKDKIHKEVKDLFDKSL